VTAPESAKLQLRHLLHLHRYLTLLEADQLKRGSCYNCCLKQAGHCSGQCPYGPKPVADDLQPPQP